jgi:hypothetical protein
VRYNVVRRPLSGGKGTIKQCKDETAEEYWARLAKYIQDDPGHYFMRWRAEFTAGDVAKFRRECLDPVLEQLCAWWDWVSSSVSNRTDPFTSRCPATYPQQYHWRHPYGVYNVLDEGGSTELDAFLETGSTVGLRQVDTLFSELE